MGAGLRNTRRATTFGIYILLVYPYPSIVLDFSRFINSIEATLRINFSVRFADGTSYPFLLNTSLLVLVSWRDGLPLFDKFIQSRHVNFFFSEMCPAIYTLIFLFRPSTFWKFNFSVFLITFTNKNFYFRHISGRQV